MLKKSKIIYILLLLPVVLGLNIYFSIPKEIHLAQNSEYKLKVSELCNISPEVMATVGGAEAFYEETEDGIRFNTESPGKYSFDVKMFDVLPVKTVDVTVLPEYYVIPSGETVGIKIYSDGLLVINVSEIKTVDGKNIAPAKDAGIQIGDRIISANGKMLRTSEELSRIINKSEKNVILKIMRDDNLLEFSVTPDWDEEGNGKKIGMWVRDSTAGVGTLTFYDPKTKSFATLGHGITDIDTGDMILPKSGTISKCDVTYTKKSINGEPGELSGVFDEKAIGDIYMNSYMGVYGKLRNVNEFGMDGYVPIATRFEIKNGPAYIMTDVDGEGAKKYEIEIEEVSKNDDIDNKGLVIHVTDKNLLEKTGGIVQGM